MDWETEARAAIKRHRRSFASMQRWAGVPHVRIDLGGTPDIASRSGLDVDPPVILVGRKWAEASSTEKKRRYMHELIHIVTGLPHGARARRIGFFSKPERDRYTWVWFNAWKAGKSVPEVPA